jgi:hypothetical protein
MRLTLVTPVHSSAVQVDPVCLAHDVRGLGGGDRKAVQVRLDIEVTSRIEVNRRSRMIGDDFVGDGGENSRVVTDSIRSRIDEHSRGRAALVDRPT